MAYGFEETLGLAVISTGGGAVMEAESRETLRRNGWIVWLRAEPAVIQLRMGRDRGRPALEAGDPLEEVHRVLTLRAPQYEAMAHEVVDTDRLGIEQVVESILRRLPAEEA